MTKKRREQKPTRPIAMASNGERTIIMTADGEKREIAQLWETVLAWAQRGDWDTLADFIEDGGLITRNIRAFLVAVLRREVKKPNNRARSFSKTFGPQGMLSRVNFFLSLEPKIGREHAIDKTAEKFGVNRRTIQRDIKEGEDAVRLLAAVSCLQAQAAANKKGHRYPVSDMALTPHFMS